MRTQDLFNFCVAWHNTPLPPHPYPKRCRILTSRWHPSPPPVCLSQGPRTRRRHGPGTRCSPPCTRCTTGTSTTPTSTSIFNRDRLQSGAYTGFFFQREDKISLSSNRRIGSAGSPNILKNKSNVRSFRLTLGIRIRIRLNPLCWIRIHPWQGKSKGKNRKNLYTYSHIKRKRKTNFI